MSSVVARRIRSTPERTASDVWDFITSLVCQDDDAARSQFLKVSGVCASIIADGYPKTAPVVITGDGPRLRIYCLYGDDAIDDSKASEAGLSWRPTESGDWIVHLPCASGDIEWVEKLAQQASSSFKIYDLSTGLSEDVKKATSLSGQSFDFDGLKDL